MSNTTTGLIFNPFSLVTITGCACKFLACSSMCSMLYSIVHSFRSTHSTRHTFHTVIKKWLLFTAYRFGYAGFVQKLLPPAERSTTTTTTKCLSDWSLMKTPGQCWQLRTTKIDNVSKLSILGTNLHTYSSIGNASLYSQTCVFLHHHTTFLQMGSLHCRFYWCSAVPAESMGASIKKTQAVTTQCYIQAPSLSLEHLWFRSLPTPLK